MSLQDAISRIQDEYGISDDFAEASNHPAYCRCARCRRWWMDMIDSVDPDEINPDTGVPDYCPFSLDEIRRDEETP